MSDGFTMLDFLSLPSLPRRVMREVLRHAPITCEDIAQRLAHDPELIQTTLDQLIHAIWLRIDDQTPARYLVHFGKSHTPRNYGIWKLAALEMADGVLQRWQPQINTPAAADDGLMRRGGKRRLPGAIWDKLQ